MNKEGIITKHDYQSYIYKLAKWDDRWNRLMNMSNLFEKYFILAVFTAIGAVFAEIGIDVLTHLVLMGVNFIRVLEYEPKVDFSAHGFSLLVLGNFAVLVLTIGSLIISKLHSTCSSIMASVHGAQKERHENAIYSELHQNEYY